MATVGVGLQGRPVSLMEAHSQEFCHLVLCTESYPEPRSAPLGFSWLPFGAHRGF